MCDLCIAYDLAERAAIEGKPEMPAHTLGPCRDVKRPKPRKDPKS